MTRLPRHAVAVVPAVVIALVLLHAASTTTGFVVAPPPAHPTAWSSSSALLMGKARRGNLGKVVEGGVAAPSPSRKKKAKKNSKRAASRKSSAAGSGVSPDLAKWMASQKQDEPTTTMPEEEDDDDDESIAPAFTSFTASTTKSNKQNTRRARQSERLAAQQARKQQLQAHIQQLQRVLGNTDDDDDDDKEQSSKQQKKSTDINDILTPIRQLIRDGKSSSSSVSDTTSLLKPLLLTKERLDYRLAWVGSDDAVCHVGTGLHKVPLARLQEVFLSLTGRNRVQLQEVIRVFGPFPNVKNILEGDVKYNKYKGSDGDLSDCLRITWDSMVDGTGKEVLAGADERLVELHVYVADPEVLIAVVPPDLDKVTTQQRSDPTESDGSHVLVFIREPDLDRALVSLRVA